MLADAIKIQSELGITKSMENDNRYIRAEKNKRRAINIIRQLRGLEKFDWGKLNVLS